MARILILDDDPVLCEMMHLKLETLGHNTRIAQRLKDGLTLAERQQFDLIILDVRLPDGSGLEALPQFMATASKPQIIIITGEGDADGAELAIETGAWDYVEKPLSMRDIGLQVTRALEYRHEKSLFKPATLLKRQEIIGNDPALLACLEKVALYAGTDTSVLIGGETGTGKELFARAIHANSRRASSPFIVLDCAAFPPNLVESILFGHYKGSFTGANQSRDGLILQADGGTLFMDEVGELPLELQKTFLRVLQEKSFRPVGSEHEISSDFRLIAATNRNLEEMVRSGHFRPDLLYRLKASTLILPPLAARPQDIEPLALHFLTTFCRLQQVSVKGVSQEFLDALHTYTWPGNIRELANVIASSITAAHIHDLLLPIHLPTDVRIAIKRKSIGGKQSSLFAGPKPPMESELQDLKSSLEHTERHYLQSLMVQTCGEISEACRISGLSRSALYERLKKYQINRPRQESDPLP